MSSKSYYDILGVASTATAEDIRKAYLVRSKMFHPDRFDRNTQSNEWRLANEMLKELNQAYNILRDAQARAEYDSTLRVAAQRSPSSTQRSTTTSSSQPAQRQSPSSVPFMKQSIIISIGTILVVSALLVARRALPGKGSHFAAGTTFLIDEDCEGTGTPSGWVNTGAVDWDNTTQVHKGAQSFEQSNATKDSVYTLSSAQSTLYFQAWIRFTSQPTKKANIVQFLDASDVVIASFENDDADFEILHGTASTATTGNQQGINTWYSVWLDYTKGTGSDGVMHFFVSTSGTKPGSPTLTITTGTSTADVAKVRIGTTAAFPGIRYYDQIKAAATDF